MMSPKGKQVDMMVQQNLLLIDIVSFSRCSNGSAGIVGCTASKQAGESLLKYCVMECPPHS
jgi:hypothetical protein